MSDRRPSQVKKGGYQGSGDPGRPTNLTKPQLRPVPASPPKPQAPGKSR